jgi:tetratricopeptide (TPR) repeat protein
MKKRLHTVAALSVLLVAGCSITPKDTSPTLKSLEKKTVKIEKEVDIQQSAAKAKKSYEALLESTSDDKLRRRAMRRLADLEMLDQEELPQADTTRPPAAVTGEPDFSKAVSLYENLLRTYPDGKDNDRILYQLSRAYEQVGEIEKSLNTLTQLVTEHPDTKYYDEAQFRRGELLFAFTDYRDAEEAYGKALRLGTQSPFFERATYKMGWAVYKQERYLDSIPHFMALLDQKLGDKRLGENLAEYDFLSGGDRQLLSDAFRVVSLAFSYENGHQSITDYFADKEPPNYEFLVYRGLGDLYLSQERYRDAAETFSAFGAVRSRHPQALLLQIDAIELYKEQGFAELVLESKKTLVNRYGKYIEFWASNSHYGFSEYLIRSDRSMEKRIEDYVLTSLEELGRYYHAQAQKTGDPGAFQEAIKWYQTFLRTFLQHPKSPEINFLLAEALYEDQRYGEAIREYEKTAYNYRRHPQGAEAGYAALLAYEEYKKVLSGEDQEFWGKLSVSSAQRFSKLYPKDPRTPAVLIKVVNNLVEEDQYEQAALFAERILLVAPETDTETRRKALVILARNNFENENFQVAEQMYADALTLTPGDDETRRALEDRVAASIYKQGEKLRDAGDLEQSTQVFLKVAASAPGSAIAATAEFDAAANLINAEQWARAVQVLERFQQRYPDHELQPDVTDKLAVAYLESGDSIKAASQIEKIAATKQNDAEFQRDAIWQAAELYEKGQAWDNAITSYKRFIKQYPQPLDQAVEARQRIIAIYDRLNQPNSKTFWQKDIVQTVDASGTGYSDRTRFLAASAALELAEPAYQAFKAIQLRAPLKENVQRKRQAMETALKELNQAAEYRVAEVTTASTYRIGDIYRSFSQELLNSERPAGLSPEALEQYELVLEDQAYPFEEKAIEIHEANADRVKSDIYDEWVKKSFTALASLLPARYGKLEKANQVIDEIF